MKFKLVSTAFFGILIIFQIEAMPRRSADDVVYDQLIPPPGSHPVDSLAYSVLVQHLKTQPALTEADEESRITSYFVMDTQMPQRVRYSHTQQQSDGSSDLPKIIALREDDDGSSYLTVPPPRVILKDSYSSSSERIPEQTQFSKSVRDSVQAYLSKVALNQNRDRDSESQPSTDEDEYSTAMVITMPKKSKGTVATPVTTTGTTTTTTRRPQPQVSIREIIKVSPKGAQYGQIINPQRLKQNTGSRTQVLNSLRIQDREVLKEEKDRTDNAIEKAVELLTKFSDDFLNEGDLNLNRQRPQEQRPTAVTIVPKVDGVRSQSISNDIDVLGLPIVRRPFNLKHVNAVYERDLLGEDDQSGVSSALQPQVRYLSPSSEFKEGDMGFRRNARTMALLGEVRSALENERAVRDLKNAKVYFRQRPRQSGGGRQLPMNFEIFRSDVREI